METKTAIEVCFSLYPAMTEGDLYPSKQSRMLKKGHLLFYEIYCYVMVCMTLGTSQAAILLVK